MVVNETASIVSGITSFWELIIGFIGGIFGVYIIILIMRFLEYKKIREIKKEVMSLKNALAKQQKLRFEEKTKIIHRIKERRARKKKEKKKKKK